MNKIVVVGLCLVLVVTFSGCVTNTNDNSIKQNEVLMIALTVPAVNDGNLTKINYSEVKIKIEDMGYVIENTSNSNENSYAVGKYTNVSKILVFSCTINETLLHAYWNYAGVTEYFDINEEKKQNQETIVKITGVLNITLDWSVAKWTISYND